MHQQKTFSPPLTQKYYERDAKPLDVRTKKERIISQQTKRTKSGMEIFLLYIHNVIKSTYRTSVEELPMILTAKQE